MKLKNYNMMALAALALAVAVPQTRAQTYSTPTFFFNNLSGNPGLLGNVNGGVTAQFHNPYGVAVDSTGNVYVADTGNDMIRKIDTTGNVTTLAGIAGVPGPGNGNGTAATFNGPTGVAVDSTGNVYVADAGNNMIRKIDTNQNVTTWAGSTTAGSANGNGTAASFDDPWGVAVDSAGNVYVADNANNMIRKIDTAQNVTTWAGSTTAGSANGNGTAASFHNPYGVAVDSTGNVYVADFYNDTIREIDTAQNVTTLAGTAAVKGSANGNGTAASFFAPSSVAVDSADNVYVADAGNQLIRKIDNAGNVTTWAGTADVGGNANGNGTAASFRGPYGVAVDSTGNIYVADTGNQLIRETDNAQNVTTLAGTRLATGSENGNSTATAAMFNNPRGVGVDSAGNTYVGDTVNDLIRKIDTAGNVTTWAGAVGIPGHANGNGTSSTFLAPYGVAADSAGNVYVADAGNDMIRKIDTNQNVTTWAGSPGVGTANGNGTAAKFHNPYSVAVDSAGNVYVADELNYEIRKIDTNQNVTTWAGSGTAGYANGNGTAASFNNPYAVAVDSAGNVYVADNANNMIRKIDTAQNVTTWAGSTTAGHADGNGTAATLNGPTGVAVDSAGNVYVADHNNDLIRKIDTAQNVTTMAGVALTPGTANGVENAATFYAPFAMAVDSAGNVYVCDNGNARITKGMASPAFSGLTASQSVTYGTTAITLTGTVSATGSTTVYPASGETIKVIINGNVQTTTTSGSSGGFSITYNPSTIPPSAGAYTIIYSYAGDASLYLTNDTSTTLTVNQATSGVTVWPTASAITYGQTLASSTLSGGTATPAGNFTFTASSTAPAAGTASQSVTYTPTNPDYSATVGTVNVTVHPASLIETANNQVVSYGTLPATPDIQYTTTPSILPNGETIGMVALSVSGGIGSPASVNTINEPVSGTPYKINITPGSETGGTFNPANYTISYVAGSLTVNPLPVTLTGSVPYSGNATAPASVLSVANAVPGDVVRLASGNAILAGATIGPETIISVGTLALGGAAAGNYTLSGASGSVTVIPALVPFSITSASIVGGSLYVSWQSGPGTNYTVLTNANLKNEGPGTWMATGTITATGTNTGFTLPSSIAGTSNGFVLIKQNSN
jgi:streptogramin lyase